MMLYEKTKEHAENNDAFRKFVMRYQWAKFYQPNADKAPWHWQCRVKGKGPYDTVINIWPHIAKAQREDCKSIQGWDKIRNLMTMVIEEDGFGGSAEDLIE